MSRAMKVLFFALSAVLIVAGPTSLNAGPPTHPGYQFGPAAGVAGTLDVSVKISTPNVTIKTKPGFGAVPAPPDTGRDVAAKAAAALCLAADASPALTCFSGAPNGAFPVAGAAPCGFSTVGAPGALQQVATCVETGDPVATGDGFTITLTPAGNFNFYLSLTGSAQFRAGDGLECEMGGGCAGTMSADLLASHNLRIIPSGTDGNVTFDTLGAPREDRSIEFDANAH